MGAVGTTKNTKKKIGKKAKKVTGTKLKIKLNKYSEDLKAKRKEMVQQWKQVKNTKNMTEDCWSRACEKSSVQLEVANKWFHLIMNRYNDYNSRHYHNDKLLIFKINLLEPSVASHLVFAIFFQYYEFDVRDFGYVENCDAFNKFYIESGINDQKLLESVLQLLGDPQFNNAEIENDLLYFQDLDLAIFGASPDEYKMFATQLQKEYVHMDENTYKNMRLKILQTFLTIPHIFSTELLRDKFEDIARTNIRNEIVELKK